VAESVVGPAHCERHKAHRIGCLACAAEECAAADLPLDEFLARMEHIGWPEESVTVPKPSCSFCGAECAEPLDRVCRACAWPEEKDTRR
jgi:hypothetical protein